MQTRGWRIVLDFLEAFCPLSSQYPAIKTNCHATIVPLMTMRICSEVIVWFKGLSDSSTAHSGELEVHPQDVCFWPSWIKKKKNIYRGLLGCEKSLNSSHPLSSYIDFFSPPQKETDYRASSLWKKGRWYDRHVIRSMLSRLLYCLFCSAMWKMLNINNRFQCRIVEFCMN